MVSICAVAILVSFPSNGDWDSFRGGVGIAAGLDYAGVGLDHFTRAIIIAATTTLDNLNIVVHDDTVSGFKGHRVRVGAGILREAKDGDLIPDVDQLRTRFHTEGR